MKASFARHFLTSATFWIVVSLLGSSATSSGMGWYKNLTLPNITPPGGAIGAVWTIIFTLAAVSMAIALSSRISKSVKRKVFIAFTINGALNIFWSVLFFKFHFIGAAFIEAIVLGLSVIALIIILRPVSRFAAIMLIPYVVWVTFATYLTFAIGKLNGF